MGAKTQAIEQYAQEVAALLQTGHAKEHAYRPALERLMNSFDDTRAVNDPKKSEHGNPDMVFLKQSNKDVILGYAEAKDIDVSLDKTEKTNQMHRYSGYDNLYLTNYLEFRFYLNGEKLNTITIGELKHGEIELQPHNYAMLSDELLNFLDSKPEQIRSGKRLALIMGAKARRIRDRISRKFTDENISADELNKIYTVMRDLLVHDLTQEKFADMYAQTLVYGLFVARYGDRTKDSFSRAEARDLVPASNPFLKDFFDHIAGNRFDKDLAQIVDELCEVFQVSDVQTLVHKHLRLFEVVDEKDPIIHFYEDFLKEYDPSERKRMGAYYTPIPVVKFIIRQVDEILKKEFGLGQGLADSSTIEHTVADSGGKKHKFPTHRVQILDPAVGTATFLNETIKFIHEKFMGQEGRWPAYARDNLVPRLHGFELMMAPYTIAHLKLGMTLQEAGVKDLGKRLGVYLTNTLEEGISQQNDIFRAMGLAETISHEAAEAAKIKHERPIMVVIGNPPYSGVSSNETEHANKLVARYKFEPGGKLKLQERKHWLNDDYVKFIAFAEDMIAKNNSGVLAMITNNGYLDNSTFRGMRWHLSKTFDKIYILDLHGSSKKKESAPDGGKDENVFDIMQGVGIIIAVKMGEKPATKLAEVYHAELWGKRSSKFDELGDKVNFAQIFPDTKNVYFVPKNSTGREEYDKGIGIDELFLQNVTGIVTMGDNFIVDEDKHVVAERVQKLIRGEYREAELNQEFGLGKNYAKFVLENAPKLQFDESRLVKLSYRPFDERWTYFDNKVLWRWREKIMKNYNDSNVGLVFERSVTRDVLVVENMPEHAFLGTAGYAGQSTPLYIYHDDGTRTPNFEQKILKRLTKNIKVDYQPEDILDYIYAVLHGPGYREKYKEFLKTDFPRVPLPTQADFNRLVPLGRELRELHLMKSPGLEDYKTTYPKSGDNIVAEIKYIPQEVSIGIVGKPEAKEIAYERDSVYINKTQYFGNVPKVAWEFYIGGYQPAQKWLKDRRGRELSGDEIDHYQKTIKVLAETDRIMKQIG